jgi:hypothetical protein
MRTRRLIVSLLVGVALLLAASTALAAGSRIELGTSIVGLTIGTGDNDAKVFGIPSSSFGLLNPAVYASIFAGPYFAVEPQAGLIWMSQNGQSNHISHVAGQVDYFPVGIDKSSPYVFGTVGVVSISGESTTPKSVGGGAGYRIPVGDRLVFRVDGRGTHYTESAGNTVAFTVSIGGSLLARKDMRLWGLRDAESSIAE